MNILIDPSSIGGNLYLASKVETWSCWTRIENLLTDTFPNGLPRTEMDHFPNCSDFNLIYFKAFCKFWSNIVSVSCWKTIRRFWLISQRMKRERSTEKKQLICFAIEYRPLLMSSSMTWFMFFLYHVHLVSRQIWWHREKQRRREEEKRARKRKNTTDYHHFSLS